MFQDVHGGGPAYLAGACAGDILLELDGTAIHPPSSPTFALDKDVLVTIDSEGGQARQIPVSLPKANPNGKPTRRHRWRSLRARRLEPSVGKQRTCASRSFRGEAAA